MERFATIRKLRSGNASVPNMTDYVTERARFSWDEARRSLDGLPGGQGLNIAHETVDRHASGGRRSHVALRCLPRHGARTEVSYGELARRSSQFANALDGLGVTRADRVFVLMPRTSWLYVSVIGALKHRCVVSPLFAAFGPEPIRERLALGGARVLVTTPDLYRQRVAPIRRLLPELRHVLVATSELAAGPLRETATAIPGTLDMALLLEGASDTYVIGHTDPEDLALIHFTSGTSGPPKGALHVHDAIVSHDATARIALDLRPDDVYWCTADPGWVTGTSYGIVAPLAQGVTSVVDEGGFDAERWYGVLESEGVTVWYTSPTALRMLMAAGSEMARGHDLSRLRFVATVGEPLGPEVVVWSEDTLGVPAHDTWWQTETGAIMVANYACMDIRPGSMGRPFPGVVATVLARDDQGNVLLNADGTAVEAEAGFDGELAMRPSWPSMFRGYLGDDERYRACFSKGWYLTGDLARRDADGYFWFVGRSDDVIKSAGHLIGPFEVESVLMEHPAVAEAGVIGIPDPMAGEIVKAFVSLEPGYEAGDDLRLELLGFARKRLGPTMAPREIAFDQQLPHTASGKVMRRLLRSREPGLARGGTATTEEGP
ncbi:MAG: acetate--CoA ligase [Actinomycetota bacterium]|nr:acetate--CoA ligase [Actinomycetota bacterium]